MVIVFITILHRFNRGAVERDKGLNDSLTEAIGVDNYLLSY